jgi:DNA-directed RNA polymerase specialized sigma24 family protein
VSERFPETSWTLLANARQECGEGPQARAEFAQRYYRPVSEFLLVLVQDKEKAQELTQEFFARISGAGALLYNAQREKGLALRSYLKTVLRNLATDYYRRTRKEVVQAHPDQHGDRGWEILELPTYPAAEASFHLAWVRGTLAEALARVRDLCSKRGQEIHFDLFESWYIREDGPTLGWKKLGARHQMDEKTARERADTVVRHFRMTLRRMLRNEITVPGGGRGTEEAIDEEIRLLLSPLND